MSDSLIPAQSTRTEYFKYNDGGRDADGYKGQASDCVARAVSIASGRPYAEVYARLAKGTGSQRAGKKGKRSSFARNGVNTTRKWFKDLMVEWGFVWVPTMTIGSGCKVHLHATELPAGRLVVQVSKHYTTMIDGVINDTWNPARGGDRCVYGYWKLV